MKEQRVFVLADDNIVYDAPHINQKVMLIAASTGSHMVKITRYDYHDIMAIQNIYATSDRARPFRIFGHTGLVIWQSEAPLRDAVGEYVSRCTPYIPLSQRARYLEQVDEYRKDDIGKAITGMYGNLCSGASGQ